MPTNSLLDAAMVPKQNPLLKKFHVARDSGSVKRFHVMRSNNTQTVADHSHGVAVLVMLVEPDCSATLLKAALTHDFHEQASGDTPSTAKWLYPELAAALAKAEMQWNAERGYNWELTENEQAVLKFCDYMELFARSAEEVMMGNRYAREPFTNIRNVLDSFGMPNDRAKQLYRAYRQETKDL